MALAASAERFSVNVASAPIARVISTKRSSVNFFSASSALEVSAAKLSDNTLSALSALAVSFKISLARDASTVSARITSSLSAF